VFPQDMFEDIPYARVEGEVRRPGRYPIDDMTVRDLVLRAGGLTNDAYTGKAQIIRRDADRQYTTIFINLQAAMDRDRGHDIEVKNEDRLVIHSVWERQWEEFVTIEGEVKNPGKYVLTKGMTTKDLIFKAGNFTRDAYMDVAHIYRTDWRTKDITIHTFSVEKAMQGDPAHDLALQDFDRVNIHSTWEFVEQFSVKIEGMVNKPGTYPYASNMTIKDLIMVAGNVKEGAFMQEAELVRYSIINDKKMETMLLDFDLTAAIEDDPRHNIPLRPMDVVTVKEISGWKDDKKTVTIQGEVVFPGTYQIRENERLTDVVRRAGGLTPDAYLRGAVLTRESVKSVQRERLDELARQIETDLAAFASQEAQAALSKEDLAAQEHFIQAQRSLLKRMEQVEPSGRLVMEMLPMDVMESLGNDIELEHGDSLLFPKNPSTVNVLGAVYNPGAQVYDPSSTALKHYLGRTGGPTDNAEEKRMFVVRADGTVVAKASGSRFGIGWDSHNNRWSFGRNFEETTLYPGDTLLVPHKVIKPSFLKDMKDITQILYQIAVTAGVTITQIF
jgi:polysaccharide biosynthesis/export protein